MAIKKVGESKPGGSGAAAVAAQKSAASANPSSASSGREVSSISMNTSSASGATSTRAFSLSKSAGSAELVPYTPKEKESLRILHAEFLNPKLSPTEGDQLWKEHLNNVVSATTKVLTLAANHYAPPEPPERGEGGEVGPEMAIIGGHHMRLGSSTTNSSTTSVSSSTGGGGILGHTNFRRAGSFSSIPIYSGNGPTGENSNASSVDGAVGKDGSFSRRASSFISFVSVAPPNDWNSDLSCGDDRRTAQEKRSDFTKENKYIITQLKQVQWCPFTALRLMEVLLNPMQYHSAEHAITSGESFTDKDGLRGMKLQETIRRCILVNAGFYSSKGELF